jgi:hypothetical protein
MLQHTERPTIDRKRERFLASALRPSDSTAPRIDEQRKRYLRSVPVDEREQASAWLAQYGELLHDEPTSDTLDRALGTSSHPFGPVLPTELGQAWQEPVTLPTLDGEPIDLTGVWTELVAYLMGDPIDDRSEHSKQAQRSAERRTLDTVERKYLPLGGIRTTGDLTVWTSDSEGVTLLAGETDWHLRSAYRANGATRKHSSTVRSNQRKRNERKEELRRVRAAREAQQQQQRAAQQRAAHIDDRLGAYSK